MAERVIRDIQTILPLLARGRALEKINEKLGDALEALDTSETKAKATLTLTLDLTREDERVGLRAAIKLKLPEEKGLPETILFAADGGLSLQHPSQLDMFAGPRDASLKGAI